MNENPFDWPEEDIAFLLGSSSDVLWKLDTEFKFTEIRTLENLVYGYARDELIGISMLSLLLPDSLKKVAAMQAMRMESEGMGRQTSTAWMEIEVVTRAGQSACCEIRSTPIRGEDGGIAGYQGVLRDISARKKFEEALREREASYRELYRKAVEQEELYKSLLSSIPHPVVLYSLNGEAVSINPAFTEVFGFTSEDVVGKRVPFVPDEEKARSIEAIRQVLAGRPYAGFESRRFTKDGRIIDVQASSSVYADHEGKPAGIVVILQDISARKEAERKLKASEQKFSQIFMRAPVIMGLTDPETGLFYDANESFLRVSGYSLEDLKGRTSIEVGWITQEERERLLKKLGEEGRCSDLEMVATAKDGRKLHCLYTCELLDIDGEKRLLTMVQDISEKRFMEEERDKAQRLEALGVLAGGLAHDFNNILTGILGAISVAQEEAEPESTLFRLLTQCEKASIRASQLVGQLMTFAKGGDPVKKLVDLAPLLEEAVSFALRGAAAKGELDIAPDLYNIEADEGQLSQTMNNLLINAAQAMPHGGTVRVSAGNILLTEPNPQQLPPGPYVSITVKDEGAGISLDNLGRIFDPYFTTKEKGTGLGLSTVYSIVRRHGGFIGVDSIPGHGTAFSILLPAGTGRTGEIQPEETQVPLRGEGRILVMDDEDMVQEMATMMLAKMGYSADCAADGQEAIDMAEKAEKAGNPYLAAILDLTISGGIGGKVVAEELGRRCPGLPLIVSSGYSSGPVMADFKRYGFSAAIPKPYRYAEFSSGISRALKK